MWCHQNVAGSLLNTWVSTQQDCSPHQAGPGTLTPDTTQVRAWA